VHRLAVLVDPEYADIEVEARVFEIIRIAAEERILFRGANTDDCRVALIAIELGTNALIQGDDVAAQPGLVPRLLFDLRDDAAPGVGRIASLGHGGCHPLGDILDGLQHADLEVHALDFVGRGFSHKSRRGRSRARHRSFSGAIRGRRDDW